MKIFDKLYVKASLKLNVIETEFVLLKERSKRLRGAIKRAPNWIENLKSDDHQAPLHTIITIPCTRTCAY